MLEIINTWRPNIKQQHSKLSPAFGVEFVLFLAQPHATAVDWI